MAREAIQMEFTATRTKLFITNNTKTIQIQIHTKKTRAAIHRNMKEIIYNKQHSNSIHKKKEKTTTTTSKGTRRMRARVMTSRTAATQVFES
mmetsp:Transcript_34236/g.52572  ORF Transcript_34236/g.52572 Transcript_34236/m.52572 type:complete len:92 (-) Transcript_34236:283-558(-)